MRSSAAAIGARTRPTSTLSAYVTLTKPRITLLVVLTAGVGAFMAGGSASAGVIFHVLVGTALVASAANALNQVLEREADGRMHRTARRPLPTGRLRPESAAVFAVILGLCGVAYLARQSTLLATALAGLTLSSYVFVYTPLKRRTPLNTLVGAVPGALPPVGGWAAVTGHAPLEAWALFLIVFLWQIPHFLAIAWILREDYARGGFRMLPVVDRAGGSTARQILVTAFALVPASTIPYVLGLAGGFYLAGALVLSTAYAVLSIGLATERSARAAKLLFVGSILYLPALLAILIADRRPG